MDSCSTNSSSDGFHTCTEDLGFESSNDIVVGDRGDEQAVGEKRTAAAWMERRRASRKKREDVPLPPPLPGLDWDGRQRTILKADRSDGRLRLTQVTIEFPQTLRAHREGGRLRLQLIDAGTDCSVHSDEEEDAEEVEDEEDECEEEGGAGSSRCCTHEEEEEEENEVAAAETPSPAEGLALFGAQCDGDDMSFGYGGKRGCMEAVRDIVGEVLVGL